MPETQTQIERLQSAGFIDSDGFLTPAGNFEATLSGYDLEPGTAERFRGYFDRGLISEDFSETEDGRIYFMNRGEVLHEGPEAFKRWYELGAWDEHEDKIAPRDPETGEKLPFINMPGGKPSVLGMGLKTLATETAPEAATAAAVGIRAAQPEGIGKFFDWVAGSKVPFTKGQVEVGAVMPPGMVKSAWMLRKTREAAGMSLEEMEKVADDMAVASVGKAITEIGRNSTWIWKGLELQEAFIQHKIHGKDAEDAYIQKLYEFEDAMEQFDDLDAVEGMMAGQAFLQIMGEWVGAGQSEEEQYAQIMRARKRVEAARERFSQDELDRMDKNFASGGQFVDLSTPVTVGASIGLRLGAVASKQVVNLNRQIAQKTAQRATVQRYIDKGVQVTAPYVRGGETVLPRGAFKQKVATLTDEIADLQGQLGKLEANTGLGGTFKDLTRGAARKTTEALSKSGRAIAETRLGKWGLEKIDPLVDATKAGLATANKFRGFALVAGGGAGGLAAGGFATGGVLAGAGLLATLPARYNILRAAFMTMRDMGNEFLRRRGTNPYWLRVAEASSENVWARKGALGMDLFRYPARIASKTAEAGAKGIIAETPFAMMGGLHRGPEVWAADAMTEGLFFGSPGMVKGMVHGMGGMPAVAKRAAFDKMALADAAEVRRNLESDQQRDAFDRLGPEHRREAGVYGATFPDIIWRFDPEATGSSWDKSTGVMTIATSSKDPMSALIGHEVAHQIHDRGLTQLVIEELVGPDGALRMTEQEYVLSQAKRNERGEIILPTEAELQAARDRARTNEEGEIVLPSDPGEMGLGPTLPDLRPLNEAGREVKRKYEARKKETIGDDELALEYYAESVGAALSGNRIKLQELARRHPLVRRLIDGTLNKFAFGREFLLRNGVLFDQYGNPAAGQGVMGAIVQSPTLARATETYLRENAGRAAKSVPEKAVERAADQVDILSPEDEDRAIREDLVNYAFDEDGNVKFLPNGRPEGIDDETWKARQTAGLTIIQDLAERYGVEPVTLGTGEKAYRLTRTQWDEVLRLLHESGWYNPRQLKIFDQMIDSLYREDGDSWHLHYHPVYKTDKVGKKRVPRQGRFAKSKLGVPYEITVSKKGNILFRMIDMDTLQNNAEKAFNTKLGKSLYNNTAEIMRDLKTLADNHREGKSNVSHFGGDQDKVNFLNAIMGVLDKAHQKKNPLFDRPIFKNFKNKHTAIFSTRLDRINRARPANTKPLPFRIEEWKKNLMPGQADDSTRRMPEQDPDAISLTGFPEQDPDVIRLTGFGPGRSAATSAKLDAALADIEKLGDRNPSAPDLIVTPSGVQIGFSKLAKSPYLYWETVISTGERRKGHASAVIKELQGIADKHGVGIEGQPEAFDSKGRGKKGVGKDDQLPQRELRRFYKARGFVPHPTKKGWILYEPKAEKVSPSDDIRRMPGPADADHRAAVEAGDTEAAQAMVDQAARAAGGIRLFHGSTSHPEIATEGFEAGRAGAAYFTPEKDRKLSEEYGPVKPYYFFPTKKVADLTANTSEFRKLVKNFNDRGGWNGPIGDPDDPSWEPDPFYNSGRDKSWELFDDPETDASDFLREGDYDAVILEEYRGESYAVLDPSKIKSADPATYDDQGNLIPLSERFGPSDDIRRMPGPADADHRAAVEAGDLDKAGDLLREEASRTGHRIKGYKAMKGDVPHLVSSVPDAVAATFVAQDERYARDFAKSGKPVREVFVKSDNLFDFRKPEHLEPLKKYVKDELTLDGFNAELKRLGIDFDVHEVGGWDYVQGGLDLGLYQTMEMPSVMKWIKDQGYDGFFVQEDDFSGIVKDPNIGLFDAASVKSADPATYDDQGNLIPLSERFDTRSDDIRRMPGPADGSTPRMGVNINDETQAFTDQILAGEKTIETRDSNSLDPYLDQKVGLVRTGQGPATLVGYADIVGVKKYTSEAEFRKDQDAHLVEPGSKYDWTPKGKVGYVLANPEAVEPYELSSRGIVARDIRRMPAKPEWVGNPPAFFDPAEPVVSVENQPGFNSGVLRGLHTAKKSVQRAFFQEIEEALAHAKSGDVIAHEMGLAGLLGPKGLKTAEPAPRVGVNKSGKVEINQAVQVGGFVSREAAELYALIRGYYTYQEAVAGYNPVEGGDMTGAQFHLGRNLKTKGEVTGVMRTIKKELREAGIKQRKAAEDFAFYPTPEGFKLVHLGFNEAITPDIRDAAFDAVAEYVNLDDWVEFDTDTFYEANNWTTEDIEEYGEIIKAAPGGEYFRQAIKEKARSLGRPNILAGVDRRVGTRLQGVYEKYSETLGLGRPGRQPSRRFKDQGALKGEEHGPEAIPVRYKTHRTGELALDEDGKPVPITEPYNLTEGSLTEGPHPEPRDPTIGYLETDELHYDLTGPQRKKLRKLAENGSVDAAADRLVDEATKALDNPEIAAGLGWYSRMRKKLAAALGEHFDIFTQFLGATSAQTPVETNFSYSMEILHQYKNGKFEKVIPSYIALRKAMENGVEATRSFLESEGVKVRASDKTVAKLGARYIEAKNLSPRRENGKLYGANSNAVLKVLAGVWFEEADAPKTPQFAMNLYGTSLRATIDVWAARTLRRIFYEGTDRWRIQPESETGVNNLDFALGQMVFARAAERLGMNPDDLQALIWFAEKDVWARNGWTGEIGAFKGSFDQAAEVYFPTGREPRRVDHGRNIITYLQKLRLVEHDDTLPAPETKDEANKRNDHAKDLQEAATLPGVREWLIETGEAEAS